MSNKPARGGARGKLRTHFLANLGRVMDSDELRAVADNQSEWARRVRELRTEEGFQISSVPTFFRGERAVEGRNSGLNLSRAV
jgi:hypothetical protein